MFFYKLPCVALLALSLSVVNGENVLLSETAGSDDATLARHVTASEGIHGSSELYEVESSMLFPITSMKSPLPFPGESSVSAGAAAFSSSSRRRRKGSRRRKATRRRRRRRRKATRRRRRSATTLAPTRPPGDPPPPTPKPGKPTPSPHNYKSVTLPDNIQYMGVGGCADKNGKFFAGAIAAGTNPSSFEMYKPEAATEYMTLQRCVDILSHLSKIERNGQVGLKGVRGLRYGACATYGGVAHCACYILGEQAQGVRQFPIEGQPSWPQQCCNPGGGRCWPCDFKIPGGMGGATGPISNQGGGFAGYCYKLKNSF